MFFHTSVVDSPTLGLLLGRDFLTADGANLNFGESTFDAKHLGLKNLKLDTLPAGHFRLELLPSRWENAGSWVKLRDCVEMARDDWTSRLTTTLRSCQKTFSTASAPSPAPAAVSVSKDGPVQARQSRAAMETSAVAPKSKGRLARLWCALMVAAPLALSERPRLPLAEPE